MRSLTRIGLFVVWGLTCLHPSRAAELGSADLIGAWESEISGPLGPEPFQYLDILPDGRLGWIASQTKIEHATAAMLEKMIPSSTGWNSYRLENTEIVLDQKGKLLRIVGPCPPEQPIDCLVLSRPWIDLTEFYKTHPEMRGKPINVPPPPMWNFHRLPS